MGVVNRHGLVRPRRQRQLWLAPKAGVPCGTHDRAGHQIVDLRRVRRTSPAVTHY